MQFKTELAELREDDMLGMVALFEKWNDMLSMYFRATLKKGNSRLRGERRPKGTA